MKVSSTVLITTANQPPKGVPFLKMTDAAIRCVTAKASVFFWAAQGIKKIVIADATGGTLLDGNEVLLLKQINADVEQISYYQDEQQLFQRQRIWRGKAAKFCFRKFNYFRNCR